MSEETIKTGIYRHFKKGDLYFVEKTFPFKQSGKEDVPSIYYYPLYEVSDGYGRSITEFAETVDGVSVSNGFFGGEAEKKTVKRFELVKELDPRYLKMLLPGSRVRFCLVFGSNPCIVRVVYLVKEELRVCVSHEKGDGGVEECRPILDNFLIGYEAMK